MEAEVFDSGDEPYLEWIENHPEGYVLNTRRTPDTTYVVLHRSGCSDISSIKTGEDGGFTARDYIKVCAEESESLVDWVAENRQNGLTNLRACGNCEPEVEEIGFYEHSDEETEPQPREESRPPETNRSASQSATIKMEDFISRVKELEGETLLTKTGSEYTAHLNEGEVVYTPLSSKKERNHQENTLRKVLKRFNETGSLSIGDYNELTAHASYTLPILKRIRQEQKGDYTPRRARDLDEPEQPEQVRREVLRVVRDSTHSRTVKEENDYECQLCGETLRLANGERYAEAHHVHPLGEGGVDIPGNIMCVCPNHHALLDYGAIPLDSEEIDGIGSKYIEYHNREIYESEQGG